LAKIVILGGGFAGAWAAQRLEKALGRDEADVLLIDRRNYFAFSPLLVEAGTGSLEPRHAVVALRSFIRRARFRMGEITGADLARKVVTCRSGAGEEEIPYDHLVLALGSATRLPPVPGLPEYGWEMKDLQDAVALRDRAIDVIEQADALAKPGSDAVKELLHFVVVGGNFTGAEVAGEFHQFLRDAARSCPNLSPDECRITLVERSDRILSALDPDLSDYATRQMRRRGIEVMLNDSAVSIGPNSVTLASGATLPTRTVIWCAGIQPPPLVARLGLVLDERGWILCEPDGRVKGRTDVWAIGDCAVNPDPRGGSFPPTAQHAVREGAHLARNLAAVLRGKPTTPLAYRSLGSLAAIGCRAGVARVFGFKVSGFAAWFLWRGVYLMKMPGWGRRLRIALDWAMDLVTRREFVSLGVHRRS
jgi:NADH dehydrogenase